MSNLGPQQQNASYDGILQIPGGVTSNLQPVQDGEGNLTGLWLSKTGSNTTTSNNFTASINGTQVTGAIPRLISDGFGDCISVKDFGAVGDGVTDDTAAVQLAINYAVTNQLALNVTGLCKLTSAVNINRLIDGAQFDNYFKIFSTDGGGFVVSSSIAMFSSSISFSTAPVSQLIYFDSITFIGNSSSSNVLNNGRFLRTRFNACNFDKILCCNSTIYTQSIQFTNCNMRRGVGNFFVSTGITYDFKFSNNIIEAWTGNVLSLDQCIGCSITNNLLEGINGTAIVYNGCDGLLISGNYFEANLLDIDGTGANQAKGASIIGNMFSHTSGYSNPSTYSVIWGNGAPTQCVSMGNSHNANMHNFPAAGLDVLVRDSASSSLYNNEPLPVTVSKISLNDGDLGNLYGGVIKGYGVTGKGGYLGLGVLNNQVYKQGITITETGQTILNGSTPTVSTNQIGIGYTTASTATAGSQTLPANPSLFLVVNVGGTNYKIPLYNN